jgi:SAM-dependent methyltransferase
MRAFVYDALRRTTNTKTRQWLKSQSWFSPLMARIFGNDIYSRSYYAQIEQFELSSVGTIADWISENLAPKRAIDVGCGPGHLTKAMHEHGISVYGVDISNASQQFMQEKGLPFGRFNLQLPQMLPAAPWDLVVCCEVAEHLEERYADTFIDNLVSGGDVIYLTAAEPAKQGGLGLNHVNEQPNSYWIERFHSRGFMLDHRLTDSARSEFSSRGVVEYLAKPLIFHRSTRRIAYQPALDSAKSCFLR